MTRAARLFAVMMIGAIQLSVQMPGPVAQAAPAPSTSRIVLLAGRVEVHSAGQIQASTVAPIPLDLADLPALVDDAGLIARRADGTIEVHVPIDQRPGSRLAITGSRSRQVHLVEDGRLSGSGAILSITGTTISATGPAPGEGNRPNPLIGYRDASGVRISRARVLDGRTGAGAGRAIDITGGQFRMVSALIRGGAGAIRLDGVTPADLIGVQIEHSRGSGLVAGGATTLMLRDVTVAGNARAGLALSGRALKLTTGGRVSLRANRDKDLLLRATRPLDVRGIRIGAAHPADHPGSAGLNLAWPLAIGLVLMTGAVILEIVRARRDEDDVPIAPDYVLNR